MAKTTKCQRCQNNCGKKPDGSGCDDHLPRFHEVKIGVAIRFHRDNCAAECDMLFRQKKGYFCRLYGTDKYLNNFKREPFCIKTIKEG